jgi:thioredoxin 1
VFSAGSLKEAVQGHGPTVVIFAAQWCSPSQRLVRALLQVEMKSPDLSLGVSDVDTHPEVPARFGVRGLPTTMLFRDGAVEATRLGELSPLQLKEWMGELT